MSDLAKQLRSLRLASGKTLVSVAREVGISTAYLSDIERGHRATIDTTIALIDRILACYGMAIVISIQPKGDDEHGDEAQPDHRS